MDRDIVGKQIADCTRYDLLSRHDEVELGRLVQAWMPIKNYFEEFKQLHKREPSVFELGQQFEICPQQVRRIQRDGVAARNRFVMANQKLLISITKKYLHRGVSFEDLNQEGTIGLIRAAEKFDPAKGYKFSTYATWWIKQAVLRSLPNQGSTVRFPVHAHDSIGRIRRAIKVLEARGDRPTFEEIAKQANLKEHQVQFLVETYSALGRITSLNTPAKNGHNEAGAEIGDIVVDFTQRPEDDVFAANLKEAIAHNLERLTDKERAVLYYRYGLDGSEMRSLAKVGALIQQTPEWTRQIEIKAIKKLKKSGLASFCEEIGA